MQGARAWCTVGPPVPPALQAVLHDYKPSTGRLSLAAGQTSGTISINVTQDGVWGEDPNEILAVQLSEPRGALTGKPCPL